MIMIVLCEGDRLGHHGARPVHRAHGPRSGGPRGVPLSLSLSLYVYIYIYIERERYRYIDNHIYIYITNCIND